MDVPPLLRYQDPSIKETLVAHENLWEESSPDQQSLESLAQKEPSESEVLFLGGFFSWTAMAFRKD